MSTLHKNIVLVLNKNWQAISTTTPAMAFCQMATDVATALDIGPDGRMEPVAWKRWAQLPVREGDESIGVSHGRVRAPTVIVLAKFEKVPMRRPKLSRRGIWERDGGRCQYTGKPLRPDEGNLDHVLPRSRGGSSDWENLVLADRVVNTRKADKTPEEAGLKLTKVPEKPKAVPATLMITNPLGIGDWNHFIRSKTSGD